MDPLIVLRDYVSNRQLESVVVEGDRINFGDQYSFSKAQPTSFQSSKGELLPLDVVLFFIQHISAGSTTYVQRCSAQGVPSVVIQDRKPLREYLEGAVDASQVPNIVDSVPALLAVEPVAKKARLEDGEADVLKLLAQQERQLRDRNTMLLAPNRTFEKVLGILDKALAAEKARAAKASAPAPAAARPSSHKPASHKPASQPQPASQQQVAQQPRAAAGGLQFMKPSGRFDRDVASDALRAMAGDAAGLAANLVYAGQGQAQSLPVPPPPPPPPAAAPAPQPQRPPGDAQRQRPAGQQPGSQQRPSGGRSGAPAAGSSRHKAGSSSSGGKPGGSSAVPIILVPAGASAMINMYNARSFLEGGHFVPSTEVMQANPIKPTSVTFQRPPRPKRPAATYVVTDKVPHEKSSDWKRVVAVICQGKAWQFKGFPSKGAAEGNLVETFNRMAGIYVHYRDEAVPDTVRGWRVTYVPIEREARHMDRSAQMDLFAAIERFLLTRSSDLNY